MPRARDRKDGKAPRTRRVDKGTIPGVVTRVPASNEAGENLPGPPELVIDEVALHTLALTHASFEMMGEILGVGAQTLSMGKWRTIIDKARAERKRDLLAAQLNTAINDRNPTMLIWMGKQLLEQKDVQRVENTGADGGPMKTQAVKAVAYFPTNNRNKRKTAAPDAE